MQKRKLKTKKKSSKFAVKWIFVIILLLVSGKLVWNFVSNFEKLGLNINLISIECTNILSRETIIDVLDLTPGENILRLSTKKLESKLISLDRIKKASVKRDFPNSLNIYIEEVVLVGYLVQDNKRYLVTSKGDIFLGTDDIAIEIKPENITDIKTLAEFIFKLKNINENFYNSIVAIESNYRKEVITFKKEYYVKWPEISNINEITIKRNIFLIEQINRDQNLKGKKINYIDLRFISFEDEKIKGALIIK